MNENSRLAALGYRQELSRVLSLFDNFAVAFSYLSPMVGVYSLYALGLGTGGPRYIWTIPIVVGFMMPVALVFGELAGQGVMAHVLVFTGSVIMIAGAGAICSAEASESEHVSWTAAIKRECVRYGLDSERVTSSLLGEDPLSREKPVRHWWEFVIVAAAVGVFVWLAIGATHQAVAVNLPWMAVLVITTLACLVACGLLLWKRTRFS